MLNVNRLLDDKLYISEENFQYMIQFSDESDYKSLIRYGMIPGAPALSNSWWMRNLLDQQVSETPVSGDIEDTMLLSFIKALAATQLSHVQTVNQKKDSAFFWQNRDILINRELDGIVSELRSIMAEGV